MKQSDVSKSLKEFSKDPVHLMEILVAHGIDADAQHEAYLLVTRLDDGFNMLNDIIHNLVKNTDYIFKKSAFVAASCIKLRKAKLPRYT